MSGRKGMTHYDAEIKRKAVRMFLEGHQTYAVIAKELGIRKAARIKVWVRRYRQEDELSFQTSSGWPRKAEAEQRELERLCMENALLKNIPYRIAGTAAHAAQYRVIYHSKKEYEVKAMGIFFGVSRAAYYGWESRSEQEDPDRDRKALVQEAYEASHKIYGYRRITLWLKQKTYLGHQS